MGKLSRCFSCFSKPSPPQEKTAAESRRRRAPGPAHFSTEPAHISTEPAHLSTGQAHVSKKGAHFSTERQAHVSKKGAHFTDRAAHISIEEPAQVSRERVAIIYRAANVREGRKAGTTRTAHVREEKAAVTIQAHFRSYLARRALRALKSLVKLQALVRGHISRKDMLHRVHSLLRVQARARAGRAQISDSPSSSAKSSQFCHPEPPTPEKSESIIRSNSARRDHSPLKRSGSKSTSRMIYDQDKQQNDWYWSGHIKAQKSEKIVEMDNVRSHLNTKRKNIFHSPHLGLPSDQYSHSFSTSKDSTTHQTLASPSSYEVRSFSPMKVAPDLDESPFCTAQNSPQFYSASSRGSRKSLFTPTKSDGSKSYLSGYMDHPNYMACTESSKAKTRSVSAPRQRTQMERSGSVRRYLVYNSEESKVSAPRGSAIHASFVNKAYPGSGRLDRLGLPVNGY